MNLKNKAFTLVELLVVITILSILSVVAYQSFGGATDKAKNVTKKNNITILGNTLQLFKQDKDFYPMPQEYSSTNLWGYDSGATASPSNQIAVVYNDQEIKSIKTADTKGGGVIYGTGTWAKGSSDEKQIGAKGVIGRIGSFNKKYLKKDIYDNQLGDIKVEDINGKQGKMIDLGIGKYVYAIYATPSSTTNWNVSGNRGKYYEIAATLKDIDGEGYITLLYGDYSKDNFDNPTNYPETLIGLKDGQKIDNTKPTTADNQGIPYPVDNFAK